jgi:hypothetical protein
MNILKKMGQDREQYRKWINGLTLKGKEEETDCNNK